MTIVVARYYENVDWTHRYPNVLIYNKGAHLETIHPQIQLENVGREGHTYFTYISEHYDVLPEHVIFLQGRPFDHSPNVLARLDHYLHSEKPDFEFISEQIHYSTLNTERDRYYQCSHIHKNWERVFGTSVPDHECIFGAGAQFIVSRDRILQHPKSFYENLVKMLEYTIDPLEGYDIERFHLYIFNSP